MCQCNDCKWNVDSCKSNTSIECIFDETFVNDRVSEDILDDLGFEIQCELWIHKFSDSGYVKDDVLRFAQKLKNYKPE